VHAGGYGPAPSTPPILGSCPLFGSLAGLPHTDVYAGSLDLLCPDTARLQQRARAECADITVVLREGLIHTWPMFLLLPEARAARPELHRALVGGRL
jgi:triacylglycerol lipase